MCARHTGYASRCLELKRMLKHTFDSYAPNLCPSNDKKEREVREAIWTNESQLNIREQTGRVVLIRKVDEHID